MAFQRQKKRALQQYSAITSLGTFVESDSSITWNVELGFIALMTI